MTKDERHKHDKETMTRNMAHFLITFTHFLMAILWIIGLLLVLPANALMFAIGIVLILTNIFNFSFSVASKVSDDKEMKIWREKVKAEILDEIQEENNQ